MEVRERSSPDTETRDRLALERTLLANERTALAYVRTSLAIVGGGVGVLHLYPGDMGRVLGWALVAVGVALLVRGLQRSVTRAREHKAEKSNRARQEPRERSGVP